MRRLLLLLFLVPAASAAAQAPPAAPTASIDLRGHRVFVAGYDGWLVYSERDRGTAKRPFRLKAWRDGVVRALPVPPANVPFDADVGPDERGLPTVVYSRCRTTPLDADLIGLPAFRTARGCRIHRFTLVGGKRERRVTGLPKADSQYHPAIWRSSIAWFQGSGRLPTAYLRTGGRVRRIGHGERWSRYNATSSVGPMAMDLRDDRVVFVWRGVSSDCPGEKVSNSTTAVHLYQLGHGLRTIARSWCAESDRTTGRSNDHSHWGAALTADAVLYGVNVGNPPTYSPNEFARLRRLPFDGSRTQELPLVEGTGDRDGVFGVAAVDDHLAAALTDQLRVLPLP